MVEQTAGARPIWAQRVLRYLDARGSTIGWLAESTGKHPSVMSRMLTGDTRYLLTQDLAKRIAAILGVPYGDIFDEPAPDDGPAAPGETP